MPQFHSEISAGELVRVVAAVVHRGEQMLVCQRPAHKRHGGLWEFPGGKCEPGESDHEALRRELHEELGLQLVSVGAPEFEAHDEGSPFMIVFVPVVTAGDPVAHEHAGLLWGPVAEIRALPLAPSDRKYAEYLCGCTSSV
jgi:mutator protein MutT